MSSKLAKDTAWRPGVRGDTFWCLSAHYLNEMADDAQNSAFDLKHVTIPSNLISEKVGRGGLAAP
jgi:hypothetical protein